MKANDLSNFDFAKTGSGEYKVTYNVNGKRRHDYYIWYCNDMTLIDATKNADHAKAKDINWLRHCCVASGTHYDAEGHKIYNITDEY